MNDFIKKLNYLDGVITYNDFDVSESLSFEKQKYSHKEDMLQIAFGDRFILDVGWLPDFDPKGSFVVYAIIDQDWMNPLLKVKSATLKELKKAIEETALFINEIKKKNLPHRNIEYDSYD